MSQNKNRKLFVNLPVSDLKRTVAFFTELGFRFDPRFTDENATCMLIGEDAYAMLMNRKYFGDFAKKPAGDPAKTTPGIYALTAESRAEVDQFADRALKLGASKAADPMDHGFMYVRSFYDLDGYHWEIFYMDPNANPNAVQG